MVEVWGAESHGKTTLAYYLASLYDLCLFIPAEGTFDNDRAKLFGNRPKQMIVNRDCGSAEEILQTIRDYAKLGTPLIIVDSVPAMTPEKLTDRNAKDLTKEARMGMLPKLFSDFFPDLHRVIEKSGTTILWINQADQTHPTCLLYTSPSPRDRQKSRMPSSA